MVDRYVDYVPLDKVKLAPRNPKNHDSAGIRTSISHFGFAELPLIDERTGRLVAGHGRHEQLLAMHGAGHAPPDGVTVTDDGTWCMPVIRGWASRSDADAESYLIGSNQWTIAGGWNDEALAEILTDQAELDLLHLTGFTADDLTDLLGNTDDDHGWGGNAGSEEARRSLAERFGVPPFTILDARQGYWQERKRAWIALGLRSEQGRAAGTLGGFANAAEVHRKIDGGPTTDNNGWSGGTSIFDPVLCELLVRWYSAPGAAVLDPFAGGSVRGVVAARLGRTYTGVDLRAEQVTANYQQASAIVGDAPPVLPDGADYTPALTPIETHGGYRVKRDDAWTRGGASGAKSRTLFTLAEGADGIITAGARRSPQIERAALVAAALGIGCRVHVPDGADTPEIDTCRAAGAEVVKHTAGRLSVLRARFRDDTTEHPTWLAAPFGMGIDTYADDVASQVANLPDDVTRVVVPCGSGMTTAGILRGLDRYGRSEVTVVAVTLGHDPTEYLTEFAPADWRTRVDLVPADSDFDTDAPHTALGALHLDPMYEAKCLPHLRDDGDLLWCVGIRRGAPGNPTPGAAVSAAPMPRWVVGDARAIRDLIPDREQFDLLLTCPPYFDLEVYGDDPNDLSRCADYQAFLVGYQECLAAATDRMRTNAFAAIVTGAVRDKHGYIQDIPSDTTRIMETLGWRLYQDAILATQVSTAAIRTPRQFQVSRKLGRTHQVVGVYHRGDIKAIREWPTPEVGEIADTGADTVLDQD